MLGFHPGWQPLCDSIDQGLRPLEQGSAYHWGADVTSSAALQPSCGRWLQLRFQQLAYETNSTREIAGIGVERFNAKKISARRSLPVRVTAPPQYPGIQLLSVMK